MYTQGEEIIAGHEYREVGTFAAMAEAAYHKGLQPVLQVLDKPVLEAAENRG